MSFVPLLRALAGAYQAFTALSNQHVRTEGLTNAQFDVIATLGQRGPMTPSDLGRETLITKGTLTGVLERLESKQIVQRATNPDDKRSCTISLTNEGRALHERIFDEHIAFIEPAFNALSEEKIAEITANLRVLEQALGDQIDDKSN